MALFCPNKVSEQDTVLNDARKPSPPQTPHLPACWVQRTTEDAQYSAEKDVAIQSEYCHQEPWVCLGQHMMFRLLGRGIGRVPHCRGILVGQRKKMLLWRLQKK